jgi:hypothetical protein
MRTDWKTFKKFVNDTGTEMYINFINSPDSYYVWLTYQNENISVLLSKATTECEDFVNNYKSKAILKKDLAEDGQKYSKITHVISGRLLKALYCVIETSSTVNNDVTGNITVVLFDAQGKPTTDNNKAVKTCVDFLPNRIYEIFGGGLTSLESIHDEIYLSSLFAPDIPEYKIYNVINKRIITPNESCFITGVGTAEIPYIESMPLINKMRIELTHEAGIKRKFQIELQYYM